MSTALQPFESDPDNRPVSQVPLSELLTRIARMIDARLSPEPRKSIDELHPAGHWDTEFRFRRGATAAAVKSGALAGVRRPGRGGSWVMVSERDARAWAAAGFPASPRPEPT